MQIEIFTLCNSAQTDGQNIKIVGSFDHVFPKTFPVQISFTVLAKVRFEIGEEGDHKFGIFLTNADMNPVILKDEKDLKIKIPSRSAVHFHIWQHRGLIVQKAEDYFFELKIDGETKNRIPMYISKGS